ncbi:hypothetical protein ACLB2K_039996 [Fragaria x ananassa]
MKICVIMHNMIIKDERAEHIAANDHEILARQYVEPDEQFKNLLVSRNHTIEFEEFISNHLAIRDRGTHSMLQVDLVEHLWQLHVARTNIDGGFWLCIGRRCYLAKVNGGYALTANARWLYVFGLAMRYNGKKRMKAAALCAITAKEIFEGLRKRDDLADNQFATSLDDKDLEYLEAASLLHNINDQPTLGNCTIMSLDKTVSRDEIVSQEETASRDEVESLVPGSVPTRVARRQEVGTGVTQSSILRCLS